MNDKMNDKMVMIPKFIEEKIDYNDMLRWALFNEDYPTIKYMHENRLLLGIPKTFFTRKLDDTIAEFGYENEMVIFLKSLGYVEDLNEIEIIRNLDGYHNVGG
jgi:hypothetical protein